MLINQLTDTVSITPLNSNGQYGTAVTGIQARIIPLSIQEIAYHGLTHARAYRLMIPLGTSIDIGYQVEDENSIIYRVIGKETFNDPSNLFQGNHITCIITHEDI